MTYPTEPFDIVLHHCISQILDKDKSIEACLNRYPGRQSQLEPLLHLTVRLQKAHAVQAPVDFRLVAAARMKNMIANRRQPTLRPPLWEFWIDLARGLQRWLKQGQRQFERLALVGILLVVALLATNNVVTASQRALPGDALYPLKRSFETLQLSISANDLNEARLLITYSRRRISEIKSIAQEEQPAVHSVDEPLHNYLENIQQLNNFILENQSLSHEQKSAFAEEILSNLSIFEDDLRIILEKTDKSTSPLIESAVDLTHDTYLRISAFTKNELIPPLPPNIPTYPPDNGQGPFENIWPFFTTSTISPTIDLPGTPPVAPWQTAWPTMWPTPEYPPSPPEVPIDIPKFWKTAIPTYWPPGWPTSWPTPEETPEPPPGWPTSWPTPEGTPEPPPAWPTSWPTPEPPPAWPTEWPGSWPTPGSDDDGDFPWPPPTGE